jgi:hypothetical protein
MQKSPLSTPVKVFYAYSRVDEALRDKLAKHLSPLEREGLIQSWHDRHIRPGRDWENEIDTSLDSAGVILLLISPDFIASEYCYGKEVKRALERHRIGEARAIPVILRPVDWHGTPIAKLQALPKDGRPVTQWSDQDAAFLDVAKGVRDAVCELTHLEAYRVEPSPATVTSAVLTAPVPDVRVEVRIGVVGPRFRHRFPKFGVPAETVVVVKVQNHSPVVVYMGNVWLALRSGKRLLFPCDAVTGEYQRERVLQPGESFDFMMSPREILKLARNDDVLCAVVVDRIDREYRSSQESMKTALDSLSGEDTQAG